LESSEAPPRASGRSDSRWSTPAVGIRGAVDALVQGALVELFQAYGVALAPMPRSSLRDNVRFHDVTANIGFFRNTPGYSRRSGRLTISMPSSVFELVKDDQIRIARPDDWARELVNQLMGRIKNRLLPFGATLHIGLPASISPNAEEKPEHSSTLRVYTGRTIRGDVMLTLAGMPDESELSYVGPDGLVLEGDIILF
jgi:hypothetical protein